MGKSAGKPGEMRYTGDVGDAKKTVGATFRDRQNKEWQQIYGEGTPKIVSPGPVDQERFKGYENPDGGRRLYEKPKEKKYAKGGAVRGYGAARGAKHCKGA